MSESSASDSPPHKGAILIMTADNEWQQGDHADMLNKLESKQMVVFVGHTCKEDQTKAEVIKTLLTKHLPQQVQTMENFGKPPLGVGTVIDAAMQSGEARA